MRSGDSRSLSGVIYPLQHNKYFQGGWSLEQRSSLLAYRIMGRKTGESQIGHWKYEELSLGDIHGGQLLYQVKGKRPIPMWRFATPVVVSTIGRTDTPSVNPFRTSQPPPVASLNPFTGSQIPKSGPGSTVAEQGFSPIRQACAVLIGFEVLPIINPQPTGTPTFDPRFPLPLIASLDKYVEDKRFKPLTPDLPIRGGKKMWPKFPRDYFGISLISQEENVQQDLFHPTDPRLIAVHRNGDVEMGTLVCDMDKDFKIDLDRMARLQSFAHVIKKPKICGGSPDENAIAWQISPSGCKDVLGGFVWESRGNLVGMASQRESGFFEVGSFGDKHKLGEDEDGNPINSLHLSTAAYFFRNAEEDGPLHFEGKYEEPSEAPNSTRVHLEFDTEEPHSFVCGQRKGKWRWRSEAVIYVPEPDPIPTIDFPPFPTPARPTRPPVGAGGGVPVGGGAVPTIPIPGLIDTSTPHDESQYRPVNMPTESSGTVRPTVATPGGGQFSTLGMGGLAVDPLTGEITLGSLIHPTQTTDKNKPIGASTMEVSTPGLLARPQQFTNSGKKDLRNNPKPKREDVKSVDRNNPVTLRMEAFGAEGGLTNSYEGTRAGASGDPWNYTNRPNNARYRGGTANGGFVLLPPEIGLEDYRLISGITDAFEIAPADSIQQSESFFIAGPGVSLGVGRPNLASGKIGRGFGFKFNQDDLLAVWTFYNDGQPSPDTYPYIQFNALTPSLDLYNVNVGGYSFLQWASLTSAQTWDLPDASGTFLLGPAGGGSFTAGSVIFAASGGQLSEDTNLTYNSTLDRLTIGTGSLTINGKGGQENAINDSGVDQDTRIEGDNKISCLLLDASDDEVAIDGRFSLVALSPATITADQNDYNPESTATNRSSFWRLATDASRTITGIANGLNGRIVMIANVGANDLVLSNQNASSTAANRIITGTGLDLTLVADETAWIIYDSTTSRWRVMSSGLI